MNIISQSDLEATATDARDSRTYEPIRRPRGGTAYKCYECGRKFATTASAERAANDGCPRCGGVDIDLL